MCQLGTCPSSVVCRSWLDVLKLKPKLVLSWGPSWPHVGGLGASWDTLRRSSGDLKAMLSHAKASSPPAQRAASEPVSKNRCAFAFNMFICLQIACMILLTAVPLDWFACLLFVFISFLVLTWSLCFICLQNSCMMLLTVVPLIWFACLLFVFFSERFPFICRAGFC